jgi:hypothetical protein
MAMIVTPSNGVQSEGKFNQDDSDAFNAEYTAMLWAKKTAED